MSFGSNVMPPRFGVGAPRPTTPRERIKSARDERKQYEQAWLEALEKVADKKKGT